MDGGKGVRRMLELNQRDDEGTMSDCTFLCARCWFLLFYSYQGVWCACVCECLLMPPQGGVTPII